MWVVNAMKSRHPLEQGRVKNSSSPGSRVFLSFPAFRKLKRHSPIISMGFSTRTRVLSKIQKPRRKRLPSQDVSFFPNFPHRLVLTANRNESQSRLLVSITTIDGYILGSRRLRSRILFTAKNVSASFSTRAKDGLALLSRRLTT